jgi:hypothetical protein
VTDVAEPKRSSKLLIYDPRHYLYCVYRADGDWSNPNTVSLPGTDGDSLGGVLQQVREKFRLATEASDWLAAGQVENPAGDEINTVWTFRRPIDSLLFVPAAYGGVLCLKPSALRRFDTILSPALRSVMRAMPDLFEDH